MNLIRNLLSVSEIGNHFRTCLRTAVPLFLFAAAGCMMPKPDSDDSPEAFLTLAEAGHSPFEIVHAPDMPESVALAAGELQHYFAAATGVRLPIRADGTEPSGPSIFLGEGPWSEAAGISAADLPLEGFRILTHGGHLHIVGRDLAQTPRGGSSEGTLLGVYAFLEDQLGIRWLIPGKDGEVVPDHPLLRIPALDLQDAPAFSWRSLPFTGRLDEVAVWRRRNRLGGSLRVQHYHHWRRVVPSELFEQHPDWFPMQGGRRVPPAGRYKLETTNPELIAFFAAAAVRAFDADPNRHTFSLSPSDSRGWSESPESLALTERDPHGNVSVTPLVLRFYNDVSRIVAETHPDRLLAGYIYADFLYPPRAGIGHIEPNFFPVIASHISYGFTLYREDIRADWLEVMNAWSAAASKIGYYDLMNRWSGNQLGAPTPVGTSNIRFIFENIRRLGNVDHMFLYGQEAWGRAGASNYVLTRMMWDPAQDPDVLRREFYELAYGSAAGEAIRALDDLLDEAFAAEYQSNDQARYQPTPDMLRRIYTPRFDRIRSLYRQALEAPMTEAQRRRLDMLGMNLAMFEWNLVQRNLVPADTNSPLSLPEDELFAMIRDPENRVALGRLDVARPPEPPPALQVRLPDAPPVQNLPVNPGHQFRADLEVVFFPLGDDQIEITPRIARDYGRLISYEVQNLLGESLASGVVADGEKIVFHGRSRETLLMRLTGAGPTFYRLQIRGAPFALRRHHDKAGETQLRFLGHTTPVYFYAPADVKEWSLSLSSDAPGGSVALADVINPLGETVGQLNAVDQNADQMRLQNTPGGGFWALRFLTVEGRTTNNVRLTLEGLNSFWVTDPDQALIVLEEK